MARRRTWRVHGPYREEHHGSIRWRVVIIAPSGDREGLFFETEAEAREAAELARVRVLGELTFDEALEHYETYLRDKGNKRRSILCTIGRLKRLVPLDRPLSSFTEREAQRRYVQRRREVSADTQLNELVEQKAFFNWLVTEQEWLSGSPVAAIKPVGKRSRGKPQFHRDEARRFSEAAFETYRGGKRGWETGLGCLLALWLGLRSSEIVGLEVRDVDPGNDGLWLWVAEDDGKTAAARRRLEVPKGLADLVVQQAAHARRKGSKWLFPANTSLGHRGQTWLRKGAERIRVEAKLEVYVPPHGLRGTQSTLATEAGVSGHLVAQQLGHTNQRVTERHYIKPGAKERVRGQRVFELLAGGKR